MIRSYIENELVFTNQDIFDLSSPLMEYSAENKTLSLFLKARPDIYLDNFEEDIQHFAPKNIHKLFINEFEYYFITLLKDLRETTKVPESVTLYGYWGEKLLFKVYYRANGDQYSMVEPYPDISFIGKGDKWYFKYNVNNFDETLFIKNEKGPDFISKLILP
ncbi:hypothetical protein GCM10010911_19160 [Paenibacillus nasutitermitis]|uniref:Uncharacterized protein n=2 Tax=Paenibacillus nasutitermitis TaxID=1652958 RepID=A0A916YU83_9BACL|nr:hypothetical protein GCM10010911_19160 [Paenibacillus nasutitermitis]